MAASSRKKRTERFNVRVSQREARLIRLGAQHRGVNITNFILDSACLHAEQAIADARSIELNPTDWKKFIQALDRPAQVKPTLKKLFSLPTVLDRS